MIHIGIDGGLDGGIVVIDKDQNIISKTVMPVIKGKRRQYDVQTIVELLTKIKEEAIKEGEQVVAVLEKALAFSPGKLALFSTGYCNGMFEGILTVMKIPYELVSPKIWQKTVLKGLNMKDTKQASIMWCKRKYPSMGFRASDRCKKDHDGLCDATGMAFYSFLRNN